MNKDKLNSKEDEAFLEALSPVVNELVDRNYERSQKKMASQIAPLLGNAIREQVKSQKNDIVDALYPVLGNMISRYVTKTLEDTLESINRQIHNGLSLQNIKRKIRAKIGGISESELLLQENSLANLRALLLIHKETGIVLAEAQNPYKPLQEPEMIASMMSAISSFVNDWIEKNETNTELGEIEYGGGKIILENGGYCYLAVVVDGAVVHKVYENIRKTLEQIILEHGEEIREFSGDLRKFANLEIYNKISTLLCTPEQQQIETKKIHPLLWIFGIGLLSLLLWNLLGLATKEVQEINQEQKSSIQKDSMQFSSDIHYLLLGLNSDKGIKLRYELDYPKLKVLGEVWDQKRKERVFEVFEDLKSLASIEFNIELIAPNLEISLFFDSGSFEIRKEDEFKLFLFSQKLLDLDPTFSIEVSGYTDTTGTLQAKIAIVHQRVDNVVELLEKRYFVAQKIETHYIYDAPEGVDALQDPQAARCVIIKIKAGP